MTSKSDIIAKFCELEIERLSHEAFAYDVSDPEFIRSEGQGMAYSAILRLLGKS